MVYYRKYRPQQISDLDLPQVREKLTSILASKNGLPHAFLFTGSKGLGKTSSARILAKAINCKQKKKDSIEPCNACSSCISITEGSNIDVLEIDAASNGGVEEIRSLREKIKFSPSTLTYKVYIVDEVHMLSTGAFNALLKTLEEPPKHVVFILATTELWKLPATVVSRTFQVLFEKPTNEQIVESLKRIEKGESLSIEDGVLKKVAHLSDGAFRDGAKLLEELSLAAKGGKITNELFDSTFKTKGISDEVEMLLMSYSKKDTKESLAIINRLLVNGADFKIVIERLVDHLRALLMLRNGLESDQKDIENLTLSDIKNLLQYANEAYSELKLSVIPSLPLELMTVKYCILDQKQEPAVTNLNSADKKETEIKFENEKPNIKDEKGEEVAKPSPKNLLPRLIEELNKVNKPGAALLRSCRQADMTEGMLVIVTPFPIHADRLKSDNVFPDLVKVSKSLLGESVELKIVVKNS